MNGYVLTKTFAKLLFFLKLCKFCSQIFQFANFSQHFFIKNEGKFAYPKKM